MKGNENAQQKSALGGRHPDAGYNATLNQMYDTVLASIDHQAIKDQGKKSIFRHIDDDAERKSDNSSISTASSDGISGHLGETFETIQVQERETPTSFLGGVVRGSTVNLKRGIVVRLRKSWKTIRGCKPIDVFLHEAR